MLKKNFVTGISFPFFVKHEYNINLEFHRPRLKSIAVFLALVKKSPSFIKNTSTCLPLSQKKIPSKNKVETLVAMLILTTNKYSVK